jgi:hypothetical protein
MTDSAVREELLARLIDALQADSRLVGAVLVGSGAVGFRDAESDLDVIAAVGSEQNPLAVFEDWGPRVDQTLPVAYRGRPGPFQLANRLHGVLLDAAGSLLELDLSFAPLDELRALRPQWKVLFDRTNGGAVRARMAAPLPDTPPMAASLHVFDAAVYRLRECRKALVRGRLWYAALTLHELQDFTLRIACLARFDAATRSVSHQRFVDDLPPALLSSLASTVVPVERSALVQALRQAAAILFDEARPFHQQAGAAFPMGLEAVLQAQLAGLD